jgi:hypothetical protein
MFDRYIKQKTDSRSPYFRFLRWVSVGLGLCGMVALALAAVIAYQPPSMTETLHAMEEDIAAMLHGLTHVPLRKTDRALGRVQRRVRRWNARFGRRLPHMETRFLSNAEIESIERARDGLKRLESSIPEWRRRVSSESAAARDEVWMETRVDILRESTRWKQLARGKPPQSNAWRMLYQGIRIGGAWPVLAVRGAIMRHPANFGFVRRMFFPYSRRTNFHPLHLLGFGLASIGLGYGWCWLGMRFNNSSLSYLGLIYFLYMIVFATCLACLGMGLIL